MSVTECKKCVETTNIVDEQAGYTPCLYEMPLRFRLTAKNRLNQAEIWKNRIVCATILYVFAIGLFYAGITVFGDFINDATPYKYAVFVLASLVYWPLIITFDSELFYKTSVRLNCLLNADAKKSDWYAKSASRYFCLFSKHEKPAVGAIVVSALCSLLVFTNYLIKVSIPNFLPIVTDTPGILAFSVVVCALTVVLQNRSRNLLVSMLMVCGGLAYYIFITEYSDNKLTKLFVDDFVLGNVILMVLVCVVFFIAGTSILPMVGMFKTFFMSRFEEKISYPIDELSCSLDTIQAIKKYFLHLTGINLIAYFQLFAVVYLLGLLNGDSIVTKMLFVLGSIFPLAMYLAANVFFKKLCHKMYLRQVKKIDMRIYQGLQEEKMDFDEMQTLLAAKEMYSNEFEEHAAMNKEIFVTMLSPIATSVFAVILPIGNLFGV